MTAPWTMNRTNASTANLNRPKVDQRLGRLFRFGGLRGDCALGLFAQIRELGAQLLSVLPQLFRFRGNPPGFLDLTPEIFVGAHALVCFVAFKVACFC